MKLLVSVRSPEEALAALEGGADLIDVKEPVRGSLGRADDAVIEAVVKAVDGRAPVSAAMGELRDAGACRIPDLPLAYLKWGLAGCDGLPWRERLLELRESTGTTVVPCAYADFARAEAPDWEEVSVFVMHEPFPVLLIDTFVKDGADVFAWLEPVWLQATAMELRGYAKQLALAGSLQVVDVGAVRRLGAEWMAVRGAACTAGDRGGALCVEMVRCFRRLIDAFGNAAASVEA